MKRLFVLTLFVLMFAHLCGSPAVGQTTGATTVPDHVTLTWTADPATTQTITWRTDTTVESALVQYQAGSRLSGTAKSSTAAPAEFTTDLGASHLFSATLTGLTPNTKYAYRVGDGKNWSETHTFSTVNPKSEAFKFLVFGDSQSGSADPIYDPWGTTVHNAYAANKDARFMVNVGDLVEIGQNGAHWNAWFAAAKGVVDSIPEMAVEGNHETYAVGYPGATESTKPVLWTSQFPLPQNGPNGLKNQVYSYDCGPVHFVVLDSQQAEEMPKYGDILEAQKTWLASDLAASQATWKIVFFHKTPYVLKASRTNEAIKAAFCPIIEKYHADLVFNGHDHGIARTYAIASDTFVQKPSQGTIYYNVGRSGNKAYPDLSKKYWNTFFFDPQDQPNYLVVEVAGKSLSVKAVKQDGTLVDTFVLDKANDIDSDAALYPVPTASWVKYAKPSLAVYGSLLSPTMYRHEPMKKDGVWFVDASAFAAYVGGTLSTADGAATITLATKKVDVAPQSLTTDKDTQLISVDALTGLGFSAVFHPETNILSVTK